VKKDENQQSGNRLVRENEEDQRHHAYNRAHPEALYGEIVDVGTALNGWPEKTLEAAFAASGGIREAKRGAALKRKDSGLCTAKIRLFG
jgi:hypothetical protein